MQPTETHTTDTSGQPGDTQMGHVYVEVTVSSLEDPQQKVTLSCLADNGATDTVLPSDVLRDLGFKPDHRRDYELADGTTVAMDIAFALLEFEGERTSADVVFGQEGIEPILGVTALESTGFTVGPRSGCLQKRSIRL